MKTLNIFFDLLLFPFLLVLHYSFTLKGRVHSEQEHWEQVKSKKLHRQFLTYIISILFFTLLATSPLSAVDPGVDCNSSATVGTGTTSGLLNPAEANINDYYKYITGGPGELIIRFESTEAINFYAGTTGCPISNYFIEVDPAKTTGFGLITVDTNTTIYIHAGRANKNTAYNFTIDFTPAPEKLDLPPNICYDYAYEQDGQSFTEDNNGSFNPRIISDNLNPNLPITVEIYVQNLDATDEMKSVALNIFDINTTEATYISGSTDLMKPGELIATPYSDINSSDSYNNDILIGDVDSREYFYVYYDIDPLNTNIDIPLNVSLDYNITYYYGLVSKIVYQYEVIIDSNIPLCNTGNFNYTPAYGIYNIEDRILSYIPNGVYNDNGFYNLPTQTANRVGNFVVAAYEANDIYKRKNVYTPVAVELIDAGKYGGTATSCGKPDSAMGPRIWVIVGDETDPLNPIPTERVNFNHATITAAIAGGQVSDQILASGSTLTIAEDFFSSARENATFRLAYNGAGHGDLINLDPVLCQNNSTEICYNVLNFTELIKYNGGNCIQDVDGQPTNIDKIPQFCNNAGLASASSMTKTELAVCMECVYGFDVNYLCSRDNFAIRPESYRISLNDQGQNDVTQQSSIALNDDLGTNQDRNHTNNTPYHVAAGYNYALQIRATNHQDDNPTPGYEVGFFKDVNTSKRSFRLAWQPFTNDGTYCNDIEDHNKSLTLINGGADLNLSSSQIGKYNLTIIDKLWTSVDWDTDLMIHHTTGQGVGYFLTGTDCVQDTSYVPSKNNTLTGTNGINLANVSGCDITSDNHTNSDNGNKYKDIALRVHPYKFDLNNSSYSYIDPINPKIGPYTRNNGQTFVYIDTPPTMDQNDTNMSYNMNGTFVAAGYDNNATSNFVDGCYAADVNMTLNFIYNYGDIPSTTPFLSYSLKDYNKTTSVVFRPDQTTTTDHFEVVDHNSTTEAFIITQEEKFFAKEMGGAITMNLGYNFRRSYNQVLNPRYIEFKDFNITHITTPMSPTYIYADLTNDHKIFGDRILDHNVSFLYGRAKPTKFFYEDITTATATTPVSIVAYCDMNFSACQDRGIQALYAQTNEVNWWLSLDHNTNDSDGDVVLEVGIITEGPGTPTVTPASTDDLTIISNAIDSNVVVSSNGSTLPITEEIDFDTIDTTTLRQLTNRWLIYNEYNNSVPSPFYRVRFIGHNDWAGHGDTGHVVDSNTSTKKNRRLGW